MNRLAVDIGGTFTDIVLANDQGLTTTKVLTTYTDPALGVLTGIEEVLAIANVKAEQIDLVLHGTTLATNALIERSGAATALVTTAGHRDVLEMALENRFEQYDVNIDRPVPLVPRKWRLGVTERVAADGLTLQQLNREELLRGVRKLVSEGVDSIAIGFLHSYQNAMHEVLAAEIIEAEFPSLILSLSSDVCPEIREYERFSTTVANAYVKPLMSEYLLSLESQLAQRGIVCQTLLMTSGGGLTTLATACKYPIRLVESGPAGGAMLAAEVARDRNLASVLSFDMGGTTAKICLIDDGTPLQSRAFEVDRSYRFKKGSGLPVRIPVVEMVEIGAGGGSIANVDSLRRVHVGPESAGSEPGPACYGRGGLEATVTDADALLGRLSKDHFAGGKFNLDVEASRTAIERSICKPLQQDMLQGAFTVSEIVEENMASAARAHASEWGLDLESRTMIAFGGAAPLHAASLAQKLKIDRVIVPTGAGVGSAIGFLIAPIKFEVVRSEYMMLSRLNKSRVGELVTEMRAEALSVITDTGIKADITERINAYMRYAGQGYEVAVGIDIKQMSEERLSKRFEAAYEQLYGRTIPDVQVEVLSWTLSLEVPQTDLVTTEITVSPERNVERIEVQMFDGKSSLAAPLYLRSSLSEQPIQGPVLIVEDQTSVVVPAGSSVSAEADGALIIERVENE
ncbi:MAG: hydantoinase/oxoprolinase family protein [Pseudomonadales bacterium]|nr:hydantoinase/oxoprolinase family protein [Pseudomonadales bacterium]